MPKPRTTVAEPSARLGESLARRALEQYDVSPKATLALAREATNVVFRVDDPATGEAFALRVHRAGRHDRQQIKSELLWLDALRAHRCVEVPPPVEARDGGRVVEVEADDGVRLVSMNGWLEGDGLDVAADPPAAFRYLGAAAAKLHAHTLGWRLPDGFCRQSWGPAEIIGGGIESDATDGGRVARDAAGRLDPEARQLLRDAEARIASDLDALITAAPDWTLLHAGLRPENVLIDRRDDGEVMRVIDFDDCGRGWLGYDAAVATSTLEHDARLPELLDAWADGYRAVRPLGEAQRRALPTFVMLRRLMLAGWFGDPADAGIGVGTAVVDWSAETCEVAERYLGGTLGV